jgi:drug/metabolite transporter (DMT)-like permease
MTSTASKSSFRALAVTVLLVALAILAFAGNSLLTRAALADGAMGVGAFTGLRLASGAFTLAAIALATGRRPWPVQANFPGVLALFGYAACFTLAYRSIGAATGALVLFASVQVSMAGLAALRGERPNATQALGLALAMAGLAWLLAPGLSAPPLGAALLMVAAGASWGVYTLYGRGKVDAVTQTARNFIGAAPLGLLFWAAQPDGLTAMGVFLAIASGAVTSGLGYVIWYAALPALSASTAGAVQLLVPAVAATGGLIWLGEPLTAALAGATLLILAGIGLTLKR